MNLFQKPHQPQSSMTLHWLPVKCRIDFKILQITTYSTVQYKALNNIYRTSLTSLNPKSPPAPLDLAMPTSWISPLKILSLFKNSLKTQPIQTCFPRLALHSNLLLV